MSEKGHPSFLPPQDLPEELDPNSRKYKTSPSRIASAEARLAERRGSTRSHAKTSSSGERPARSESEDLRLAIAASLANSGAPLRLDSLTSFTADVGSAPVTETTFSRASPSRSVPDTSSPFTPDGVAADRLRESVAAFELTAIGDHPSGGYLDVRPNGSSVRSARASSSFVEREPDLASRRRTTIRAHEDVPTLGSSMSCCEDPFGKQNKDKFNNSWDPDDCTPGGKKLWYSVIGFLFGFLIIVLPCIMASSVTVSYESNAILLDNGGSPTETVGPGRHWPGITGSAVTYPRFDGTVEYVKATGSAVVVRVRDGQIVELDLSFQYALHKDNLQEIYKRYKTSEAFVHTLKALARSVLRDRAAGHFVEAFFSNRTGIEEDMREQLSTYAKVRDAIITGFQIRQVYVPKTFSDRLIAIEMSKQEARQRNEQLAVERIVAETEKERLKLETQRMQNITGIKQQTQVEEAVEAQTRNNIEQSTIQEVTKITEESRRIVTLFNHKTELLVEDINLNITTVQEQTRRETEALRINGTTTLELFVQETTNMQLEYEKKIALIEESSRQAVATIEAETAEQLEGFLASLANKKAKVKSTARKAVAVANQEAEKKEVEARLEGYSQLPGFMFLAEEIANSTLQGVKFMDASTSQLVDTALAGSTEDSIAAKSEFELHGSGDGQ